MLDNHLSQGNALGLDTRRILWKRVVDMNDRALRNIVLGLGGTAHGVPREGGFEITVASEVMAILCLARDLADFKARAERIVVGETADGTLVEARGLKAAGAMAVLMKDAIKPNLVQTLEGTPAFIHGGPFGNIAHGCNSLIATRLALKLGEIVVTEAGFASDLGAEKFIDIKCRTGGLKPTAAVIVATVRALKLHGGVAPADLGKEDVGALRRGSENLAKHVENVRTMGLSPVVALNHFSGDTAAEVAAVTDICRDWGVPAAVSRGWELGGAGHDGAGGSGAPCDGRRRPEGAELSLSRRRAAGAEDRGGRHQALRRRRRAADAAGGGQAGPVGRVGVRPAAGVHGQDPELAVRRRQEAGATPRLHGDGARRQAGRRSRASSWPTRATS